MPAQQADSTQNNSKVKLLNRKSKSKLSKVLPLTCLDLISSFVIGSVGGKIILPILNPPTAASLFIFSIDASNTPLGFNPKNKKPAAEAFSTCKNTLEHRSLEATRSRYSTSRAQCKPRLHTKAHVQGTINIHTHAGTTTDTPPPPHAEAGWWNLSQELAAKETSLFLALYAIR